MKSVLITLIFLTLSPFLKASSLGETERIVDFISSRLELLNYEKSNSPEDTFSVLLTASHEIRQVGPSFHQTVVDDILSGKPLHGSQLTLIHKIVGIFVSLDYKFRMISKSSDLDTLKLLSKLERYDNFLKIYYPFYTISKFRRIINAEDISFGVQRKQLKYQLNTLLSKKTIGNVKSMISKFNEDLSANTINYTQDYVSKIKRHAAIKPISNDKIWKWLRRSRVTQSVADYSANSFETFTHALSQAFGNSAGSIQWRKGHLLNNSQIIEEIRTQLQPLDIITEKIRFSLTDTFIPGHFGHNAIWLGSPSQLKSLGLWNHESIVPFHSELLEGKSIIETDRSGTHFKSLDNFMNVDEFALLRLKPEYIAIRSQSAKVLKVFEVAVAQLGKSYDFNFDVETTDQLVCSELLYQSFGDVNWPTEYYIGRTTISPDNVASLAAYENAPTDLIYYVEGRSDGTAVRKSMDDFAEDIGFVKVDGSYRKPVEVCNSVEIVNTSDHAERFQSRCEIKYIPMLYQHHRPVPTLNTGLF